MPVINIGSKRLRGDLIQAFKLLKDLDQINYNNFFVLDVDTGRRGHTLKVAKPRARLDIRLHNLSHIDRNMIMLNPLLNGGGGGGESMTDFYAFLI